MAENSDLRAEIGVALYEAMQHLGAKSDLLGIVGSYGDTMDDERVLAALRGWNKAQALAQDLATGGVAITMTHPDLTIERIDPQEFYVHPAANPGGRTTSSDEKP